MSSGVVPVPVPVPVPVDVGHWVVNSATAFGSLLQAPFGSRNSAQMASSSSSVGFRELVDVVESHESPMYVPQAGHARYVSSQACACTLALKLSTAQNASRRLGAPIVLRNLQDVVAKNTSGPPESSARLFPLGSVITCELKKTNVCPCAVCGANIQIKLVLAKSGHVL